MSTPERDLTLHYPERSRRNRGNAIWNATMGTGIVAAIVAGALATMKTNSPQCEGTQRVALSEGDVPQLVAQEHIDVTSGYVDIQRMINNGHRRPPAAFINPFYDKDAEIRVIEGPAHQNPNISGWQPGDIVVMPQTCTV